MCDAPLPPPKSPGHRRREYCDNKGQYKQQMYLFHKKMKEDVDLLKEPYWKMAYEMLLNRYLLLEERLQDCLKDMEGMQQQIERLEQLLKRSQERNEDERLAFRAKLRALGLDDRDIRGFEEYWLKASNNPQD
jgi:DNA-binding transcriptional regulator GbsR (MarR family)